MATGRIGTADLGAATDTTIYTTPASLHYTVASVSMTNRGATSPVVVQLGQFVTLVHRDLDEYLEYDVELLPRNVLERTGIIYRRMAKLIVA